MILISKVLGIKEVSLDMKVGADLNINSLKIAKLIIEIEDYYGIEFEADDYLFDSDLCLRDLYKLVERKSNIM